MHVTRDLSPWFCGTRELFVSFCENPNFFLRFSKLLAPSGSIQIYERRSDMTDIEMPLSAVCYFCSGVFRSHTVKYSGYQTSKGQLSTFETWGFLAVLVILFVTAWKRMLKSYLLHQIQ